ncbi:hypothetical protein ACWDOP_36945 [Nocardia sp. NPDC003693]
MYGQRPGMPPEPWRFEGQGEEFERRPVADIVVSWVLGIGVLGVGLCCALWFLTTYFLGEVGAACGDAAEECGAAELRGIGWLDPLAWCGFWIPLLALVTTAVVDYVSDALEVRGHPGARRVPLFIWPLAALLAQLWLLRPLLD